MLNMLSSRPVLCVESLPISGHLVPIFELRFDRSVFVAMDLSQSPAGFGSRPEASLRSLILRCHVSRQQPRYSSCLPPSLLSGVLYFCIVYGPSLGDDPAEELMET
jgi:hypothetical protein